MSMLSKAFKSPTVKGFFSGDYGLLGIGKKLFGQKEQKPVLNETPLQEQSSRILRGYYDKYATDLSSPYEAYGGDLTPDFTPNLDNPDIWGVGEGEIRKTLEGGYDPYSSDYYKSMREGMLKEQDVAANRLAGYGQKVGAPQSATMGRLEQLGTDTTSRLGQIMAELGLNERQNKLSMVPYASSYGTKRVDLDKYNQENKFNLQDTTLQRQYQEWLRRKQAESGLMSMVAGQPQAKLEMPQYKPSKFSQGVDMAGDVAQIASLIAMFSDVNLKENLKKIGKTDSGLNIYRWDWKNWAKKLVGNTPNVGVIAQEVIKTIPKAVSKHSSGFLMVNYSMI